MKRIYGRVNNADDIRRINCIIRDEMLQVETPAQLTDLKKRSDYLCTLTYSPFWKKKFGDEIEKIREVACAENRVTVETANTVAEYKDFDGHYKPWGKHQLDDIDEALKEIPEAVVHEVTESYINPELHPGILEELRQLFCELRAAMAVCPDETCLNKIKRAVDLLSALPYYPEFSEHFTGGILKEIDSLINTEKQRSVQWLNMVAYVRGYPVRYLSVSDSDFEDARDYIDRLLKEEKKSGTYIPTGLRYKGTAKVLWLTYYLPNRKRDYAKRIYFPADFKLLMVDGPGEFKNRFGNPVYGLRIVYEMPVKATTIHVRGHEIHLPERWIKKEKIVPVPQTAQNIRLSEEKPKSAMDIA